LTLEILNDEAGVQVSGAARGNVPFDALARLCMYLSWEAGIVEDVVGGEKFIYSPEVSLGKNRIEPLADQEDLVFFGHGTHPSPPTNGSSTTFCSDV